MKRLIIITIAIILFTSSALASIDELVEFYNLGCILNFATMLSGDPTVIEGCYIYKAADSVNVFFRMDGDDLISLSCVCTDESGVTEFLAQCITAFAFFGKTGQHEPLLKEFFKAHSGRETEPNSSVEGTMFRIVKESYGYTFVLVKVK